MDLKSGYPWWAVRNGLIHAFPALQQDLRCDVLVVGGGITGALIADELSHHGHDVAVIEQRDIGWGSTAASTALLQYEIDTHLLELTERYGQDAAALAYRACAEAIPALGEVARGVKDVDFQRMDSLYLASRHRDVPRLMAEGEARRSIGLDARWLGPEALRERFDVDAGGALLTRQAARVDPYRLTYGLLQRVRRRGGNVHDRTVLHTLTPTARGVSAVTKGGATIHARHVVLAMGYANQTWLQQRVARNRSSYAFITDPIDADVLGGRAHARTCTCVPPATAACWWAGWMTPSTSPRAGTAGCRPRPAS